MNPMRKTIRYVSDTAMVPLVCLMIILGCAQSPTTREVIVADGGEPNLATFKLQAPSDPEQRQYLGIETDGEFTLNDIRAQILIIEVFNFYCPHCQREAPMVNRLYRRITSDPELRERIKLIGIGVNNTRFEVEQFGKVFAIPFPLFPDRSRDIAHLLDVRQTPTFIGFVWEPGRAAKRFLHSPGSMGEVDAFLSAVIRQAETQGNGL